jgi:hypothetical protein
MSVDLLTRAEKGSALSIAEHDANLAAIQNAINALDSEVVSVKRLGAVGNGIADDTDVINTTILALKSTSGQYPHDKTRRLFFPNGDYKISSSILTFGGVHIFGEGDRSRLYNVSGIASGRGMIELEGEIAVPYCSGAVIENMGFESAVAGVWAIKQSIATVQNCRFEHLFFDTIYGLGLDSYSQGCLINHLYSYGDIERFLYLKGNFNKILFLDKEGGSGTSSEPYVEIVEHATNASSANSIDMLLIEGEGHANKVALRLDATLDTEIGTFWCELTACDAAISMADSKATIRSFASGSHFGIVLDEASKLTIEDHAAHSSDVAIADLPITFSDAHSLLHSKLLSTRRGDLNTRHPQHIVDRHRIYGLTTSPLVDISAEYNDEMPQGENIMGPGGASFEGALGWWIQPTSTFSAVTYPNSELAFDSGLKMFKGVVTGTPGTKDFDQVFIVPAGAIGRTVEFEIWSKIVGTTDAVLNPLFGGLNFGALSNYGRNWGGRGWVKHRMRGRIGTSGSLHVYLRMTGFVNGEELYLDASRLVVV